MKKGDYAKIKSTGRIGMLMDCSPHSNIAFIQFSETEGHFISKTKIEVVSKKEIKRKIEL